MTGFELAFGLVALALWLYFLVDVIGRGGDEIRNLPKLWWLIVLFFPFAGSVAYLVVGRPEGAPRRAQHERAVPEFDRPGRAAATEPGSDEEFLRKVRERAEEQRRLHRETQHQCEREAHEELQRRIRRPERDGAEPDHD